MSRCRWRLLLVLALFCTSLAHADDQAVLDQAVNEYQAENYEEALALLQPLTVSGEDPRVSYYIGLTLKRMGNNRDAMRHLQEAQRLGSTEPALYRELVETALASDDLETALATVNSAESAGVPAVDMAYYKGVIHLRRGQDSAALAAFAEARQAAPELAAQAEFQSAQIYARQNNLDEARRSLQAVIALAPTSDVAAYAADYERQFARGGQPKAAWHGYGRLGYLYDSNAIAAPERSVPGLFLPDEKDNGLTAGFGLEFTPQLTGRKLLSARYDVSSVFYADNTTSNQLVQTVTLSPGYGGSNSALSLPTSYSYSLIDNSAYQQLVACKPTFNQRLNSVSMLQLRGGYTWRDMLFDYANSATEQVESRSANIYAAGAAYYRFFAEGQGMASLRYEWTTERTDGSNWENQGHRVSFAALLPLTKDMTMDLTADYYAQRFDNVNSFFGVTRRDNTLVAGVGLSRALLEQLKAYGRYQYIRDDSNIDIYNYKRHTVELGLEYRF
jgi:Flp pilus assembly protein TadD